MLKLIKMLTMFVVITFCNNVMAQYPTNRVGEFKPIIEKNTTQNQSVSMGIDEYCIPSGNCDDGDGITDFSFAGIENLQSGCSTDGYGDYTEMTATVEIGYTYTASIASGYPGQYASIWIDLNKDFEFTNDELVLADFGISEKDIIYDIDINIPAHAEPGLTYMRIGVAYGASTAANPCATLQYGEWEDYGIEITGSQILLNAGVVSIDISDFIDQGDVTPKATIVNLGMQTISFPVTCTIDDGYSSTKNVTDLAYQEEIQIEFDIWNATTTGVYSVEIETALNGDEITENNTLSKNVGVVLYQPEKRVIGEEGTGTWCGWCVRGIVYMDSMLMKYPDTWIGIAVHNGDPMTVDEYDEAIGFTGFPSGLINRTIDLDPSGFEAAYLSEIEAVAPAGIIIENKAYNPSTAELTFTLTSDFVTNAENFRFSAVLIENHVTNIGSGWAQSNAYSGGASGEMGGFEDLPSPVPASDMIYMDVARALIGGFDGIEGSLPANLEEGNSYSYDFSTTVSDEWNIENIEIVGMLINNNTGKIENATKNHAVITSLDNSLVNKNKLLVYPNPTRDILKIENMVAGNIHIYNLNGQLLMEKLNVKRGAELDFSGFESGTYIIKIINEKESFISKFNIIK